MKSRFAYTLLLLLALGGCKKAQDITFESANQRPVSTLPATFPLVMNVATTGTMKFISYVVNDTTREMIQAGSLTTTTTWTDTIMVHKYDRVQLNATSVGDLTLRISYAGKVQEDKFSSAAVCSSIVTAE